MPEDEWRFSVDDVGDSPANEDSSVAVEPTDDATAGDEKDDASVAGEFSPEVPVVPERPELENAAFVTLGSILTVIAIASVVGGTAFGLFDALLIAVVLGAIGAVAYGAFVRLTPDT